MKNRSFQSRVYKTQAVKRRSPANNRKNHCQQDNLIFCGSSCHSFAGSLNVTRFLKGLLTWDVKIRRDPNGILGEGRFKQMQKL